MRWTFREVRSLLRLVRRPHDLERHKLAIMLRDTLRASSAREAVQTVIDRAFEAGNPTDRMRREIIHRCDIGGATTRETAAFMHVSVRQFFRYRAEAVAAISYVVEQLLRNPADSEKDLLLIAQSLEPIDPKAALDIYLRAPLSCGSQLAYDIVRTSVRAGIDVTQQQIEACDGLQRMLALAAVARFLVARGDDKGAAAMRDRLRSELSKYRGPQYEAAEFELAFLDRLDARRTANTARSRQLTERMRTFAGQNEPLHAIALIAEAEQALIEGDSTAAALTLDKIEQLQVYKSDINIATRSALAKAMLFFVRGFYEQAYRLAQGMAPALAALESGYAMRAEGIAGRAALFTGTPWLPASSITEKYPNVWTRAHVEAVAARHLLQKDVRLSQATAEFAIELASRHQSPVLLAYGQASLAAALDIQREVEEAQQLRVAAWKTVVECNDEFALYDLFFVPGQPEREIGPMSLNKALLDELHGMLARDFPETHSSPQLELSKVVVKTVLEQALDLQPDAASGIDAPEKRLRAKTTDTDTLTLRRFLATGGEKLAHLVCAFVSPPCRPSLGVGIVDRWQSMASEVERRKPHGAEKAG